MTRHLVIFADPNAPREKQIPRATLAQVLYSPANPNKSRKLCENCTMWSATDENCAVHDPNIVAQADFCCAYHIFGLMPVLDLGAAERVQPEFSGLVQVGSGGRACDRCQHYQPRNGAEGTCAAVQDTETASDAVVQALASCARWESADG